MSSHDDNPPRSHRERPRHDPDAGLKYPDELDEKPAPRRARYDTSPAAIDPRDEPRHKRDVDPRDVSPRDAKDERPSKSNTAAPRRRRSFDDDDVPPRYSRNGDGHGDGYGRSKGYRQPVPATEDVDDNPKGRSSKHRDYDDEFDAPPPRRANTHREPDRRRRDDPYDREPPRRRQPSPGDRYSDREKGSKSDDRDRRRRDDDRYDDRRHRGDGYASDRGHGRSDRDRRDRDRDRDYRDRDRDRERDRDRDRDRDRRRHDSDRDRDRYRSDRDRDRDRYDSRDRDRGGKKKGFSIDNVNDIVEMGQKHYKTVAPIISSLSKMYFDKK